MYKISEDTLKEINNIFKEFLEDVDETHICNLCKSYNLLNQICEKTNKFSNPKGCCGDWRKC